MNIVDLIEKKKNREELTKEEIDFITENYLNDTIKDYQLSSLLMAITINGMSIEETYYLTDAMLHSGAILDLSGIEGTIVDKHSTGGVGDKVTLILAPLLASLDIKIAKMSGRGLGYTGGTIDKLESIPNFDVNLTKDEFIKEVNTIGMAVSSPTEDIAPSDKKIYALRDVTGTVNSIPLIASSILSKKLASNADIIVIDVTVGKGALIKTLNEASMLSKYLIEIGKRYNKKIICLITDMNEPLGYAVGNKLEVLEAIDALKGYGSRDLMEVVYSLSSILISEVRNISIEEAYKLAKTNIDNGSAYNKFKEFISYQKGNLKLDINAKIVEVTSTEEGYINEIDALDIAKFCFKLGTGRENKDTKIDYDAGIRLEKKTKEYVKKGDLLGRVYCNRDFDIEEFRKCFKVENNKQEDKKLIYGIIKDVK